MLKEIFRYLHNMCFQYDGWKMDPQLEMARKSCVKELFVFYRAHKNKISTAIPMLSGLTFLVA